MGLIQQVGKKMAGMTDCIICGKSIQGQYDFCATCYGLIKHRLDKYRRKNGNY